MKSLLFGLRSADLGNSQNFVKKLLSQGRNMGWLAFQWILIPGQNEIQKTWTIQLKSTLKEQYLHFLCIYTPIVNFSDPDAQPDRSAMFRVSQLPCQFLGYGLYFASTGMFTWMSILCFDLLWTFTHMTGQTMKYTQNLTKWSHGKKEKAIHFFIVSTYVFVFSCKSFVC